MFKSKREKLEIHKEEEKEQEEIFSGTYILDDFRLTKEEQREKIFDMMKLAGVEVDDKDEIEIRYEGAEDDFGISETQTTEFRVYKVKTNTKEYVLDENDKIYIDEIDNNAKSEKTTHEEVKHDEKDSDLDNKLVESLEEIKKLREELDNINDTSERNDAILNILEKINKVEEKLKENGLSTNELENELNKIDEDILNLEAEIKKDSKKYEESFEKLRKMIINQNNVLSNTDLLSEEEYKKLSQQFLEEKTKESNISTTIKNNINLRKKELSNLKRKKNKIRKDIETAQALGLSSSEYQDLTSTLRKTKIMNAILEEKGLTEIISKKASERTKEEEKLLKETRKQIETEVAEVQKEKQLSAKESIEVLYNIDTKVLMKKTPRKEKVTKEELDTIKENVSKLPNKVLKKEQKNEYVPDSIPRDMVDIYDNKDKNEDEKEVLYNNNIEEIDNIIDEKDNNSYETEDIDNFEDKNDNKEIEETPKDVITIYKLSNDRYYVNKATLFRFVLDSIGKEEEFDGEKYYKIDREDAEYIINNSNNEYSPYEVDMKILEKEDKDEKSEKIDYDTTKDVSEKIVLFRDVNNNKIYVRKSTIQRFTLESVGEEENIEGTACYPIDEEDARYIIGNTNNGYSPYQIEIVDFTKETEQEVEQEEKEDKIDIDYDTTTDNIERIILFRDLDNDNKIYVRKSVVTRFHLSVDEFDEQEINGVICYPIDEEDAKYIIENANNGYSPYQIEFVDINLGMKIDPEEEFDEIIDEIVFYNDVDNDKTYVNQNVMSRFRLSPIGESVMIDGEECSPIDDDDKEYIKDNKDNSYSPYTVREEIVHLGKKEEPKEEETTEVKDELDVIVFYNDVDNNITYVNKAVKERFRLLPIGESEIINGEECFPIDEDDREFIFDNQDNEYSPYRIKEVEVHLGKKEISEEDKEEETEAEEDTKEDKEIIIYRDTNDDNQLYISVEFAKVLNLSGLENTTKINGVDCIKIDKNTERFIHFYSENSKEYNYTIKYIDVALEKEYVPHVEEILEKITEDLEIGNKDVKRYKASNIKISKTFADELHSGNYAYNIVHLIPAVIKAGVNFFRKLGGKLFTSLRAKQVVETMTDRIDNLSEKELEVLFTEYKGTQLKTDMNNQINPLILDSMRKFGLKKVDELNEKIKNNYSSLFIILGQIKAIEEKLEGMRISSDEAKKYVKEKDELYKKASKNVREILDCRKKANDLLSSGVHGLEEDYKAVATKMNYVGLRFGKNNNFDNELQKKLAEAGHGLNVGLSKNNAEEIVENFMALEGAYFDNTEITGSLLGRRSVGTKYYTPLAEQFNYNDDPFIRDLFTTVAITSSVVSAANAVRVHKCNDVSETIDNSKVLDDVHNAGKAITDRGESFRKGMAAQAEQDVLNAANTRERLQLDMSNWKFTDAYHAADKAGHQMYNAFSDNVRNQINGISSRYAQGAITQGEALRQMADLTSSAQSQLVSVVEEGLKVMRDYAKSHPQFDLHAYEDTMSAIVQNPGAIVEMGRSAADVIQIGEYLQTLTLPQQQLVATLPSDLVTTLVNAGAAVCLAANVSSSMNKKYSKKVTYGDEITDMMDRYKNGVDEFDAPVDEEETVRASHK